MSKFGFEDVPGMCLSCRFEDVPGMCLSCRFEDVPGMCLCLGAYLECV